MSKLLLLVGKSDKKEKWAMGIVPASLFFVGLFAF
jgi:hypothetical protein